MKQMIIDVFSGATSVAVLENKELVEYHIEKLATKKIVGNIYKGKVVNVLPGMQAAFVNIGFEQNAFLYAGDTLVDSSMLVGSEKGSESCIKDFVRCGDDVLCQVVKDEFGSKGARLTMGLSIPGRVLVLMPLCNNYIGVSKKIEDGKIKDKLIKLIEGAKSQEYGYIIRTEAQSSSEEEILAELKYLESLYKQILSDYKKAPTPSLIHEEEDLVIRVIRDLYAPDIDEVIINSQKVLKRVEHEFPYLREKKTGVFKFVDAKEPLPIVYNFRSQITDMLEKRVTLKNGAHIVIDCTEALTIIDVNTGKYIGNKNLEETVFKTNCIAAIEIAKQLRLRNISGIIVVDFIDMEEDKHKKEVLELLDCELKKDKIKSVVVGMTELGLVQITRKKTRNTVDSILLQSCPYCLGDGYVYSESFIMQKIKYALIDEFNALNSTAVKVYLNTQIQNKIFSTAVFQKECREDWADKIIYLVPDDNMHIEKFVIESVNDQIIQLPDNARLLY